MLKVTEQISKFWYRMKLLLSVKKKIAGEYSPTSKKTLKSQMGELKLHVCISAYFHLCA